MTAHTIDLTRDRKGQPSATTSTPLDDSRELRIVTSKDYRKGLSSTARVFTRTPDRASWTHAFGLAGGGDFSKTLAHDVVARATEKKVQAMHAAVLVGVDELVTEARQHYATGRNL